MATAPAMSAYTHIPKVFGQLAELTSGGSRDRRRRTYAVQPLLFFPSADALDFLAAFRASASSGFVEPGSVGEPMSRAKADPSTPASAAAAATSDVSKLGGLPLGAWNISTMKWMYRTAKVMTAP